MGGLGFFLEGNHLVAVLLQLLMHVPLPPTQHAASPARGLPALGAGGCGCVTGDMADMAPALTELMSLHLFLEI